MEEKNLICPVCGCQMDPQHSQETCPRCGSSLDAADIAAPPAPARCCPICQTMNPGHAQFCTHCGFPFAAPVRPVQPQPAAVPPPPPAGPVAAAAPQPVKLPEAVPFTYNGIHPEDTIDGIPASEIAAFVGSKEKADYYLPKVAKMAQTGKKISWNWMGFLVFPYWALYRRMIKPAIIYLSISFVLIMSYLMVYSFWLTDYMKAMMEGLSQNPSNPFIAAPFEMMGEQYLIIGIYYLIQILVSVVLAMFANHFYWKLIKRRLRPSGEQVPDHPPERIMRAEKLGGVKISYPLITAGVEMGVIYAVSFLIVMFMMFRVVGPL